MMLDTASRGTVRRRSLAARVLAVVGVVAAVLTLDGAPASAASPGEIKAAYIRYKFQNWDYDGSKRDNPVSIVFVSNYPNMVGRVYEQVATVGLTGSGKR